MRQSLTYEAQVRELQIQQLQQERRQIELAAKELQDFRAWWGQPLYRQLPARETD